MSKRITAIMALVLTFALLLPAVSVSAASINMDADANVQLHSVNKPIPFEATPLLVQIDDISTKEVLKINGVDYPLFCTFDNPQTAISNIAKETATVIMLLKDTYELENFSIDTVSLYYDALLQMLDDETRPSWYSESNLEFRKFRAFYDIFENYEKNALIHDELESRILSASQKGTYSTEQIIDYHLLLLLPYTSYENAARNLNISIEPSATVAAIVNGFDTSKGIKYAEKYAESPNKAEYHYFRNGDCANFTSQILEYGGISQEVYDSEYSGWWHKTSTNLLGITTHTHSRAWTMADTFSRYMGVYKSTTSHYTFTTNIKAGDFVTADFDSDGDWDHMGFVTDKGTSLSQGYYDYEIAQHTDNYLAWASSDDNGWDTVGPDGGTYARVRRSS